uniref:RBR-type E3 ubiquitin transferase n=1 Tax=Panagrolaimus sp. ES5 TaxID=591445 RepID=A0AC34GPD7_9BILA
MDDDHPSSDISSEADYDYDYEAEDDSVSSKIVMADPEYVVYKCYKQDDVVRLFKEEITKLAQRCKIEEDEAIFFAHKFNFDEKKICDELQQHGTNFFLQCKIRAEIIPPVLPRKKFKVSLPFSRSQRASSRRTSPGLCRICYTEYEGMRCLSCGHEFCSPCWTAYFVNVLQKGISSKIECMESKCEIQCLSGFVTEFLQDCPNELKVYMDRIFRDSVIAHPNYRYCPGTDCQGIIYCESRKSHRVTCDFCKTSFCVQCGFDYHAPSSCEIMSQWRKKCGDDSETANYIRAHTKDCPKCSACIEKNGGCNHMQCSRCDYHFCWMCFKDWKSHGSEYYECSRYKENPAVALEAKYMKARHDLERYLHYFERFDNHSKSLKLEEELRAKIIAKIEQKVEQHEGTWIDWQYLHDAASLLTKCRYTLQYTYPFAYYLESGQRKELFEYQQAQLEKEIEELSWKVERAESTDRADLEKQMHVAECKRRTLLQDFLS